MTTTATTSSRMRGLTMVTCADCTTRYAQELGRCPHCMSTYVQEASAKRLPSFVAVSCTSCGWGPRQLRMNSPHPGLIELPALFCAACGSRVQIPWPPVEDGMPKITAHGGATNARDADLSPAVDASTPPVVAEGDRGSSSTVLVGEPGPELFELPDEVASFATGGEPEGEAVPGLDEVQDQTVQEVEPVDYDAMTLAELRAAAEEREVPSYGTKAQIAARLREGDQED